MGLARTHSGWENEHFAAFLMSRIAFVASPMKVADDVGTDLFCTLHERRSPHNTPLLVPRNTIAVQIKSSSAVVNASKHVGYLARLEMPFYVGVVDQKKLSLDLYSVRFLPVLLTFRGKQPKLKLRLVKGVNGSLWTERKHGFELKCPKIVTLRAQDKGPAVARAVKSLGDDAALALQAIASRLNKDYVFDLLGGGIRVFAGKDSAKTFREGFYKRLAQAFKNFSWLLTNGSQVRNAEIEAYLSMYDGLVGVVDLPEYVQDARNCLVKAFRPLEGPGAQ
jgi:hypothetical protein